VIVLLSWPQREQESLDSIRPKVHVLQAKGMSLRLYEPRLDALPTAIA